MRLPPITYHRPSNLAGALGILELYGEDAVILGGGTDLLVRVKQRICKARHVISLRDLPGFTDITKGADGSVTVGAGVRLTDAARSPVLNKSHPVFCCAASLVATAQIRNMGTVAGNLLQERRCLFFNRSGQWGRAVKPCFKRGGEVCHAVKGSRRCFAAYQGDLAPVLDVIEAKVIVDRGGGTVELPTAGLFSTDGSAPNPAVGRGIVVGLVLPAPQETSLCLYRKYRLRQGADFPLAGAALSVSLENGVVQSLKVCLTGVGSAPVPVDTVAEAAQGKRLDEPLRKTLADLVFKAARPVDNVGDSAPRRRRMAALMVEEMLSEVQLHG